MTVIINKETKLTAKEYFVFSKLPNKTFSMDEVSKVLDIDKKELDLIIEKLKKLHLIIEA